jgi:monooxygenase
VTATGLTIQLMGGMHVVVDGTPKDLGASLMYKSMMYSDIPNLASSLGYTNASWTLKCELTAQYVCRLITYMDRHGYAYCMPRRNDASMAEEPVLGLTSGYLMRAAGVMPKQGSRRPWKLRQNYLSDLLTLRFGSITDGAMEFTRRRNTDAAKPS